MATWRGGYIYRGDLALVVLNAQIMARRPHPDLPVFGSTGRLAQAPCGTRAALRRHQRRGERACEACLAAERRWHRLRAEARRRAA